MDGTAPGAPAADTYDGGMTSPPTVTTLPTADEVTQALSGVNDPEIHRPITELGMVKDIDITRSQMH